MPWKIVKVSGGYYVETISTGRRHSKEPMTKAKAEAQLRVLESKEPVGNIVARGPLDGYRGRRGGKK